MMPRRYSALLVLHRPTSAVASGDRYRFPSAHSATEILGGGLRLASRSFLSLARNRFTVSGVRPNEVAAGELTEHLPKLDLENHPYLVRILRERELGGEFRWHG